MEQTIYNASYHRCFNDEQSGKFLYRTDKYAPIAVRNLPGWASYPVEAWNKGGCTMSEKTITTLQDLLDFVAHAPEDQSIIAMDCNDHCEQMATLAERVASGEDLQALLPQLQHFLMYWRDCREEFLALVAVLKAELSDELPELSQHSDAPTDSAS